MVSQCTKFEVSRFTRYDAMNGGAKCRKRGSLGHLGGTQGHRQCPFDRAHATFYSTLIETMRLSCTVFEIKRGYLSKVADFDHPAAFGALVGGDPGRISRRSSAPEN